MTYPNPNYQPPQEPRPNITVSTPAQTPNPGLSFLGFSGGMLALVIAGVIILPIAVALLCCLGGGALLFIPTPDVTPTP